MTGTNTHKGEPFSPGNIDCYKHDVMKMNAGIREKDNSNNKNNKDRELLSAAGRIWSQGEKSLSTHSLISGHEWRNFNNMLQTFESSRQDGYSSRER
jgi:hypothetical protein